MTGIKRDRTGVVLCIYYVQDLAVLRVQTESSGVDLSFSLSLSLFFSLYLSVSQKQDNYLRDLQRALYLECISCTARVMLARALFCYHPR